MDQLLEKNREGIISRIEKGKLEQLVAEAEQLMVANAKRLEEFSRREKKRAPTGAVPVTVWIQAEQAEP